jgi:hypothetical protein
MKLKDFCKVINDEFSDTKYKKWYIDLVSKTLDRVDFDKPNHKKQACFFYKNIERHHICPIAIFPQFAKEKENLAYITPKEHFIAHALLLKMCRIDKKWVVPMAHAVTMMKRCNRNQKRILNSNQYNLIRLAATLARKGVPRTEETKEKLSKARKGQYKGKLNGMFGVEHKRQSKIKMSINSLKNIRNIKYDLTLDTWENFVSEVINYTLEKRNCREAMRHFGINDNTIRRIFKQKGIECPNGNKNRKRSKRSTI